MRRNTIDALKPVVFAIAAALASAAAFANEPTALRSEQAQDAVGFKAIDNFLVDSRRHLGL
ncbi:MAG: hypothetical protein ACTS8S_08695 [Giesbergeria sp.]